MTLSGLSLLPRAKRAICFRVLDEAALQGIQCSVDVDGLDSHSSASSVLMSSCSNQLVDFVIFAATCLIGETDPRCLMQMLQLLFQMQSVVEEAIYNVGKEKDGTAAAAAAAAANIKGFPLFVPGKGTLHFLAGTFLVFTNIMTQNMTLFE